MRKGIEILRRVLVPLALVPLLAACGAGGPKPETWDVTGGQYLTEAEYQKLSSDEAIEYCRDLAQELDILRDNAMAAGDEIPGLQAEVDDLQRRLDAVIASNQADGYQVAELEERLRMLQTLPPTYTVAPGDWLRKISAQNRIYSDEKRWTRIFRRNRDQIANPNLIYPGQVFGIPRGLPTNHTVREGETLRIIAGYWEIYGDRSQSGRIFEANRDKISNPNVIHPGMVLVIPR